MALSVSYIGSVSTISKASHTFPALNIGGDGLIVAVIVVKSGSSTDGSTPDVITLGGAAPDSTNSRNVDNLLSGKSGAVTFASWDYTGGNSAEDLYLEWTAGVQESVSVSVFRIEGGADPVAAWFDYNSGATPTGFTLTTDTDGVGIFGVGHGRGDYYNIGSWTNATEDLDTSVNNLRVLIAHNGTLTSGTGVTGSPGGWTDLIAAGAVFVEAIGGGLSGTADLSEAGDALSASGSIDIVAAVAVTAADDTVSAAGALAVTGTAAITEAGDTLAASDSTTTTVPYNQTAAILDPEFVYTGMWGAGSLTHPDDFDVYAEYDGGPDGAKIHADMPESGSPPAGVWGYTFFGWGSPNGGEGMTFTPQQISSIDTFWNNVDLSFTGTGKFTLLYEAMLTTAPGAGQDQVIEVGIWLHAGDVTNKSYFYLSGYEYLGHITDRWGQTWECHFLPGEGVSDHGYAIFIPAGFTDKLITQFDYAAMLRMAIDGVYALDNTEYSNVTDSLYLSGVMMGMEPLADAGLNVLTRDTWQRAFDNVPYVDLGNASHNIAPNGTFDGLYAWEEVGDIGFPWSGKYIDGGALHFDNVPQYYPALCRLPTASGRKYEVQYTISDYSSGSVRAQFSDAAAGSIRSANGTYTEILTAPDDDDVIAFSARGGDGSGGNTFRITDFTVTPLFTAGAASVTEAGDAVAAAGALAIAGSADLAEAGDAATAGGALADAAIEGGLAATEAADGLVAAAVLPIAGALAAVEAGDSVSAAGEAPIAATLDGAEDDDAAASAAALDIAAEASLTDAGDACSASGAIALAGVLALTEAGDSAASAGVLSLAGSAGIAEESDALGSAATVGGGLHAAADISEEGDVLGAAADLDIAAAASIVENADTGAGAGKLPIVGTLAVEEAGDTAAAQGTLDGSASGSSAIEEEDDTAAAAGSLAIAGTAAPTESGDALAATGSGVNDGDLSAANDNDTIAASGSLAIAAALDALADGDTVTALAVLELAASLSATEEGDSLEANGGDTSAIEGGAAIAEAGDSVSAFGRGPVELPADRQIRFDAATFQTRTIRFAAAGAAGRKLTL